MHLSVCLYVKGFIDEESFKDHERGKEFESSRGNSREGQVRAKERAREKAFESSRESSGES